MKKSGKLTVAIVHDWLIGGGAENVVSAFHELYPDAPIYTSYATDDWRKKLGNKVVTGYLQYLGPLRKFLSPLRALWFSHLDLSGYDLVISSSGAEAKGVKVTGHTVHVNYCHAPTHYYWSRYDEYIKQPGFGFFDPLARIGLKILLSPMRRWDYKAAQRPHYIIANSTHIQQEIKKYYGRESKVIHPPVDTEAFQSKNNSPRAGFIVTGRQTPYKRFDLPVLACTKLGLPLTVVGDGPDSSRLKQLAGPTISFKGWLSRSEVVQALQTSEAFIFPGLDDFGISAVEALAAGTPVVAYKAGGSLDYVVPGKTGEFFTEQTVESLATTLHTFKAGDYSHEYITQSAQRFSNENFGENITRYIDDAIKT